MYLSDAWFREPAAPAAPAAQPVAPELRRSLDLFLQQQQQGATRRTPAPVAPVAPGRAAPAVPIAAPPSGAGWFRDPWQILAAVGALALLMAARR